MYEEPDTHLGMTLRWIVLSLVVMLTSVIFLVYTVTVNSDLESPVVNADEHSDLLSRDEITALRKKIGIVFTNSFGTKGTPDMRIRWSTFRIAGNKKQYVVDVDEAKQSVLVIQSGDLIDLGCPSLIMTSYPDSFCPNFGDYADSLGIVFGNSLPVDFIGTKGRKIKIYHSESDSSKKLNVFSNICSTDKEATEEIIQDAKNYVKSLGAGPDIFEYIPDTKWCRNWD